MAGKNPFDSVVRIPASLSGSFFRFWFEFLTPIHKLSGREIEIITALVKQRYELSKVIKDDEILDSVLMGETTKRKIREECNISVPHFQVILSKLKKNKLIIDGKINKRFIPRIEEDAKEFKLLLYFDLNAK